MSAYSADAGATHQVREQNVAYLNTGFGVAQQESFVRYSAPSAEQLLRQFR